MIKAEIAISSTDFPIKLDSSGISEHVSHGLLCHGFAHVIAEHTIAGRWVGENQVLPAVIVDVVKPRRTIPMNNSTLDASSKQNDQRIVHKLRNKLLCVVLIEALIIGCEIRVEADSLEQFEVFAGEGEVSVFVRDFKAHEPANHAALLPAQGELRVVESFRDEEYARSHCQESNA
jgi:hypothetical protein